MRRFLAVLLVVAGLGVFGAPAVHADGPAQAPHKPAPTSFAHGRPVYNFNTLKRTPGVTVQKLALTPVQPPASASAASATSSTYGSGYGWGYVYNAYNSILGSVSQSNYLWAAFWYGVPLCVRAETDTTVNVPYIPVRATAQLYLSTPWAFQSYWTGQAWTTNGGYQGYSYLSSGCYGTVTGDTWYNLSSWACGASYYCNGSTYSYWYDSY